MMPSSLRVSICIPTYNRATLLLELLDSIAGAVDHDPEFGRQIEVCISDNASTDKTVDAVRAWKSNHPEVRLTLQTHETNSGPDRNYLAAASMASGQYIWFMGSDDTLPKDALHHLFATLVTDPELALGARTNCNFKMEPRYHCGWFLPPHRLTFNLREREHLKEYFSRASSLGAQFSYLSSVIVRRDAWENTQTDPSYIGSAYVHVQKCMDIVRAGAALVYQPRSIVNNRGDNDFFISSGAVNRVMIDIRAYVRLSKRFDSVEMRKLFLIALRRERPMVHTAFFLRKNGTQEQWREAYPWLRQAGAPWPLLYILGLAPSLVRVLDQPFVQRAARRLLGRRLPKEG